MNTIAQRILTCLLFSALVLEIAGCASSEDREKVRAHRLQEVQQQSQLLDILRSYKSGVTTAEQFLKDAKAGSWDIFLFTVGTPSAVTTLNKPIRYEFIHGLLTGQDVTWVGGSGGGTVNSVYLGVGTKGRMLCRVSFERTEGGSVLGYRGPFDPSNKDSPSCS